MSRRERQIERVIIVVTVLDEQTRMVFQCYLNIRLFLYFLILDTLSTMAEFTQDFQQWKDSTGFHALLDLNKRFLRGEILSSPYHYGPIEDETHSLVTSLLKLHERQIFT
jgi:hypothetical protein